jgi:5-hydroxyisourate hydrolase-like protein (transthyretin family)
MSESLRFIRLIKVLIPIVFVLSLLFLVDDHTVLGSASLSLTANSVTGVIRCPVVNQSDVVRPQIGACYAGPLTATLSYSVYLPLIRNYRPPSGIYGYVTNKGVPAEGVPVNLERISGSVWSYVKTTYTQIDGSFAFTTAPSLASGQRYAVDFYGSTSNQLGYWATKRVDTYAAGSTVHIGDFDIANVDLLTPTNGVSVTLPYTFQWTPRSAVPSDSYELYMTDGNSYYYSTPLGYVGSFPLTSLPTGFVVGQSYYWGVNLSRPDGSHGFSYEGRQVTFSGAGLRQGIHVR